jgi:hypothetical protein
VEGWTLGFSDQCTGYPKVPKRENCEKKCKNKGFSLNIIATIPSVTVVVSAILDSTSS